MARKPRLHSPGAVYHVILRGNARHDIFADDKDRYRFYSILEESVERFNHRIHGFCLMTTHVHLEIQVAETPLSKIMQNVSMRYTQWFNWRHNRSGHVFQGRYKAIMVDADEYLLELLAYIHLNPIRAHITDRPEKYRWSSHQAYLGKESLPWLDISFILSQFSSKQKNARRIFAEFVGDGQLQGRRKEFHGEKNLDCRIFGDDRFVELVLAEAESLPLQKPDLEAVIDAVKRVCGISEERLAALDRERGASEARGLAAWATVFLSSGKLTDLAKVLRRDPSTLTRAARGTEMRRQKRPLLAEKVQLLQHELRTNAVMQA